MGLMNLMSNVIAYHPTVLATGDGLVLDVDYSLGAIEAIERGNI